MISDVTKDRHAKRNGAILFIDLNVAQNGKFGLMFRQDFGQHLKQHLCCKKQICLHTVFCLNSVDLDSGERWRLFRKYFLVRKLYGTKLHNQ